MVRNARILLLLSARNDIFIKFPIFMVSCI
jgi:hypothetical protein